jgi:hypothetical protein
MLQLQPRFMHTSLSRVIVRPFSADLFIHIERSSLMSPKLDIRTTFEQTESVKQPDHQEVRKTLGDLKNRINQASVYLSKYDQSQYRKVSTSISNSLMTVSDQAERENNSI